MLAFLRLIGMVLFIELIFYALLTAYLRSTRREALEAMARLVSPMMPHLAEELWSLLRPDEKTLVAQLAWLDSDPALAAADSVTLAVQVLGKLRATLAVPIGTDEANY